MATVTVTLSSWWIFDLFVIFTSIYSFIYFFYLYWFNYWSRLGIKHTKPAFPFGDFEYGMSFPEAVRKLYNQTKHEPFIGIWMFYKPMLLINDLNVIKTILIKDFSSYQDRGFYLDEKLDPLSANLLAIGGEKWRYLRTKMSPTFTSGKIKMMFPTLVECSEALKEVLHEPARNGEVVEVKEIAARFTTDIISSVAFGIEANSLKNPNAIFRQMGKKMTEPNIRSSIVGLLTLLLPSVTSFLRVAVTPGYITKFFMDTVKETMDYREENNVKRNDFMQLLIQLKNKGHVDDVDVRAADEENGKKITLEEAAAQAFLFFSAAFETSSTTMQFALYELSLNSNMQEKVREEIISVLGRHEGKITYEAISEMSYLGRIIDETLRKYPPIVVLQRVATRNVELEGCMIPKGAIIQIPTYGIHMDPKHYPEPERFNPDRFTEQEKAKRHHFAYLPFGEGPRNCIGMKIGLTQIKVGLATLLSNFRFEVCKETPVPMVFDKGFSLTPKNGMNLKINTLDK